MLKQLATVLFLFAASTFAADSIVVPLWPGGAPGSEGKSAEEKVRITDAGEHVVSSVHHPSLTVFLPAGDQATGAAVIIAPGGGHRELWMDHEGYNVARWLSAHGIAGLVLKYRLAREPGSTYTVEGTSLADAQRAIRLARDRAQEWRIRPDRIGIMGFSAGGEVAALAAQRFDAGNRLAEDPVDQRSSRPDFQALIYPAIPAENRLTAETPPAFLVCGEKDRESISQGLPQFYLAMRRAGISAELHVYYGAGHGFGVRESNHSASAKWIERFREWLEAAHPRPL